MDQTIVVFFITFMAFQLAGSIDVEIMHKQKMNACKMRFFAELLYELSTRVTFAHSDNTYSEMLLVRRLGSEKTKTYSTYYYMAILIRNESLHQ